ncbi:MAG: response regulator [Desulfobulbaceae bacterium]|nr:response regulator [Desulfobulbaceae bacterium]
MPHKYLPKRLGPQIALTISMLLFLLITAYTWHTTKINSIQINNSVTVQAEIMAHSIANLVIDYLLLDDYTAIESLLIRNASSPDVLSISITDPIGNVISDVIHQEDSLVKAVYTSQKLSIPNTSEPITVPGKNKISIWTPVYSSSLIGWVYINYSLRAARQINYNLLKNSLTAGGLLLLLSTLLILLFMKPYMILLSAITTFSTKLINQKGEQLTFNNPPLEIQKLTQALNNTSLTLKSQHQKLLASEQKIKTIIDASISAIILINEEKYIELFNPAAEKFFGYQADEVIGQPVNILIPEPYKSKHDKAVDNYLKTGIKKVIGFEREAMGQRKDNTLFPLNLAVSEIQLESRRMFVGLITDITKRKQNELSLKSTQKQLVIKNNELEVALERAQAASHAKSTFLASMSHEIRTPLNAIIGMADLLNESDLSQVQKQYVDTFNNAGNNLLCIINDILDLSKIEAGHFSLENICFDLQMELNETCEIMTMRAQQKNIQLTNNISPVVPNALIGDPTRLRQVIVNLIGNAIKFTAQGEIILSVEPVSANESEIELIFSVKDTGIGISTDKLESIFEKFNQADTSTTRKYGGTGLGLSISQRIVEMMQGRIWVESIEGQGSKFSFTAHFNTSLECKTNISASTIDLTGYQIMVVDNNATNRTTLNKTLRHWKSEVIEASNGKEGLKMLTKLKKTAMPVSLLLIDYDLQDINSLKMAEIITQQNGAPPPIIIISSSSVQTEYKKRVKELGLYGFLTKPINTSTLKYMVMSALNIKPSGNKEEEDKAERKERRPLKILVADDNKDNRNLIKAYLKKTPHTVEFAENGAIAVKMFKNALYDIVLMDIQMPEMDGHAATKAIRYWEKQQQVPKTTIIALTAHALKEHKQASYEAGCDAHLTKPIKKAKLLKTLEEAFDQDKQSLA